jgi:hypothetical protein
MALLTETNEQYYGGQQAFTVINPGAQFITWTADTPLVNTTGTTDTNFTVTVNGVAQPLRTNSNDPGYQFTSSTQIILNANVLPITTPANPATGAAATSVCNTLFIVTVKLVNETFVTVPTNGVSPVHVKLVKTLLPIKVC